MDARRNTCGPPRQYLENGVQKMRRARTSRDLWCDRISVREPGSRVKVIIMLKPHQPIVTAARQKAKRRPIIAQALSRTTQASAGEDLRSPRSTAPLPPLDRRVPFLDETELCQILVGRYPCGPRRDTLDVRRQVV